MSKRWALTLGVVAVVLLVAALLGADRLADDDDSGDSDGRRAASGGASEPPAGPGEIATVKTPRVEGTARSVAFEGRILRERRVEIHAEIRVITEVFDGQGKPIGRGTLVAGGGPVVIEGDELAVDTSFTATPGALHLTKGSIHIDGDATVTAPRLRLETAEEPNGRPLTSPVRIDGDLPVDFEGRAVLASAELELAKGSGNRATLSWAGGGRIDVPGEPVFTGEWLGVKAKRLAVALRLADLHLEGTHDPQQVYVDGVPQLRADKVGVDIVRPPDPVPVGGRGWFEWAPRNRSGVDMAIMKIGPGNAEAGWVNLALDALPRMFGGENRTPPGGDAAGLGKRGGGMGLFGSSSASPIDAVILPGTADKESISFDVPSSAPPGRYELVLVLEGNFDPVRVTIPVDVVADSQPPRR